MEEKRQNNTEEIELFHAVFKLSKPAFITFISLISIFFTTTIAGLCWWISESRKPSWYSNETLALLMFLVSLGLAIIFGFILLIRTLLVNKNSCVVTNKRIFGAKLSGLVLRTFSYRLDKIDNAQAISCLGMRYVKFGFSKGSVGTNPIFYQTPKIENFSLSYVYNHMEFYVNLSKLIVCIKNDTDITVDLINSFTTKK